ncbi:DUF503 domain-containing protein [Anaeromicrobium sediminis]|uniref:DUF503 domain-containing protein n=1 Tax=Anaeromicrobium sediminis TaxID=1478221 RepID=A0A267MPV2_9FIRM|nr:DUF503 domain-containing protein [Anaeromicrobium sediminis]PAB60760.1 hypothetical protein CCE28_04270 [Anaeromicrobium sediminis]
MIIGSCHMELFIYEVNSLKEKRQILKSIIGRVQSRFNVSIGEVGLNDVWRRAEVGVACVSTNTKHALQMIDKIVEFIQRDGRIEIISCNKEIL